MKNKNIIYDPVGEGFLENLNYYLALLFTTWIFSLHVILISSIVIHDVRLLNIISLILLFGLASFFVFKWKRKRYLMPRLPLAYKSIKIFFGKLFTLIGNIICLISLLWLAYIIYRSPISGISGVPFGIGMILGGVSNLIGIIFIELVRKDASLQLKRGAT